MTFLSLPLPQASISMSTHIPVTQTSHVNLSPFCLIVFSHDLKLSSETPIAGEDLRREGMMYPAKHSCKHLTKMK